MSGPPDSSSTWERRSAAAKREEARLRARATRAVIRHAPDRMDRLALLDMLGLLSEEQQVQLGEMLVAAVEDMVGS